MSNWLDSAWKYRRSITIDNNSNSNTLTNYQIKLTLNNGNFDFGKANSNGSDIRFTDSNDVTKLILDSNKWYSNGDSISDGTCRLYGGSGNAQKDIKTKQTFPNTIHVYTKWRRSTSDDLNPNIWYTNISITNSSPINGTDQNGLAIWSLENSGNAVLYLNKSKKILLDNYITTNWTNVEFRPKSRNLYTKIGADTSSTTNTHSYNNQPITITINSDSGYDLYVDYICVVNYTSPTLNETVGNEELASRNQHNSSFYNIYQSQYKELTTC